MDKNSNENPVENNENEFEKTIMTKKILIQEPETDPLGETTVVHALKDLEFESGEEDLMGKKKKNNKRDWSFYAIIISLAIFLVPTVMVSSSLISARMKRGVPLFGERYKGDHDPAITNENMTALIASLGEVEGVSQVGVSVKSGTLRILLLMDDSVAKDSYPGKATETLGKVYTLLPQEAYFTRVENLKKMYDLDISLVNQLKRNEDEPYIYYSIVKGSMQDNVHGQFASDAVSPSLVEELMKPDEEIEANE